MGFSSSRTLDDNANEIHNIAHALDRIGQERAADKTRQAAAHLEAAEEIRVDMESVWYAAMKFDDMSTDGRWPTEECEKWSARQFVPTAQRDRKKPLTGCRRRRRC